jgi:dynein heavy chain
MRCFFRNVEAIRDLSIHPWRVFSAQYETIVVRHGLMLVGPTGGGKTSNLKVLKNTLTALKKKGEKGFAYEKVHIYQMNPKAIRMGQLYGEFDANTHEWEDGILCSLYRVAGSFYFIGSLH